MANSIVAPDMDTAAQLGLKASLPRLIALMGFSQNFTDNATAKGKTINVTQHVYPTAASKDFAGNYADTEDVAEIEVPVVLSKHLFRSHKITQDEQQLGGVKQENIENQAHKLIDDAIGFVFGKILAADFASAITPLAASAFDSATVNTLRTMASKAHWPKEGRNLILNADFYGGLGGDSSLESVMNSGTDAPLITGDLPNVKGFAVQEYVDLPLNGEALAGIAAHKNAVAIATGVIVPSSTSSMVVEHGSATDEATGFTYSTRRWTDPNSGTEFFASEILLGATAGEDASLIRIPVA